MSDLNGNYFYFFYFTDLLIMNVVFINDEMDDELMKTTFGCKNNL